MTKFIATLGISAALAFAAPGSSEAQGPVVTGGLVNVTVANVLTGDILNYNNISVGAALNIAANVCGVAVNVLATQLGAGTVRCENATSAVTITRQKQ